MVFGIGIRQRFWDFAFLVISLSKTLGFGDFGDLVLLLSVRVEI